MTALLSVSYVKGKSTRQPGAMAFNGNNLTEAAFMNLRIVGDSTTLDRYREWSAWDALGDNSAVAALLGM